MTVKDKLQELGHEPMPILRAIRAKCLDCSGGSHYDVTNCLVRNCALYPFRHGTNPWRAEMSPERREMARQTLIKNKAGNNPDKTTEGDAS